MNRRAWHATLLVLLLVALLTQGRMLAQEPKSSPWAPGGTPPFPLTVDAKEPYGSRPEGPAGNPFLSAGARQPLPAGEVAALATGGPDDFGYTWDDSVPFDWIDATVGIDSGLNGDDQSFGPVDIGLDFRFYENTYSQLYFSTNGLVTFGQGAREWSNMPIPVPAPPNNFVAAFWDDLCVKQGYNNGTVYYLQGGTAPDRYFVVEWHAISLLGSSDLLTFEAILYENGDIVLQYLSLSGYVQGATVGIEDDAGETGLQYLYNAPGLGNNLAVRFHRPAPTARVAMLPQYQGGFANWDTGATFQQTIRNSGELGSDTYNLTTSSPWMAIFAADGVTPLSDTDGDGTIDTGPMAQGQAITITVSVLIPGTYAVGQHHFATVTARSSLDPTKEKTATFQTAIPAPFAQVLLDGADAAMSIYLVQPGAQSLRKTSPEWFWGTNVAVAETPNSFVYAWSRSRGLGNVGVSEVEYALLNRTADTVRPVTKLTDHSGATVSTYDYTPVVAVAPDGHIGVLWYRALSDGSRELYNIFFAILDAAGNVAFGPLNLTDNSEWYQSSPPTYNAPQFWSPAIAATHDNRFVLAWVWQHQAAPDGGCSSSCWVTDIYYAVRATTGDSVRGITCFTSDTPGWASYGSPNLTRLSGNRALLTWAGGSGADIYYAVLGSGGGVIKAATNLVGDGQEQWDGQSDATQLADGRTVIAWVGNASIRFAVLDRAYQRVAGPTTLTNPAATFGNEGVSVAPAGDHAVLTWMDSTPTWQYRRPHLYYALVGGDGTVLTPPMIFYSSLGAMPRVETSFAGYGNTSYSASVLRFQPTSKTVYSCASPFTVEVQLQDVFGLGGFEFGLAFDPQVVHVESIAAGGLLSSTGRSTWTVDPVLDNGTGQATFGVASYGAQPAASGSGPLASITFSPVATGTTALTLQAVQLTDPNASAIVTSVESGSVTVLPALTSDMDCDCDVDIVDIMLVASRWNSRTGDPRYDARYDLDQDGDIDIVDIMLVATLWNTRCSQAVMERAYPRTAKEDTPLPEDASRSGTRIERSAQTTRAGETFTIAIEVENVLQLGGFEFTLEFAPSELQVEDVMLGSLLESTGRSAVPMQSLIDNGTGSVRFGAFSYGTAEGASGSGTLAHVVLRRVGRGNGHLAVSELQLTDTRGHLQTPAPGDQPALER